VIYIVGNSNIRSFCFIKEVVPLFLGPQRINNFNNIKNTERTAKKILGLISNLDRNDKVIVFLGYRYSVFSEDPSDENLCELLSLFEYGLKAIADNSVCKVELITPAAPTKLYENDFKLWVRLDHGLQSLFRGSKRIKVHSFAKLLNIKEPLDGDTIFDEIHISGSTALAIVRGILNDDIGIEAWRYSETVSGSFKGSTAKIVGDIPYYDLDIKFYETLNFSVHYQDSLAVEFFASHISKLFKGNNKNSIIILEEGEGFITRYFIKHMPNSNIISIYRNANTMKKALAVNKICGFSPKSYLFEELEFKLQGGSIFIVDGFEKIRDEYKKIIIAATKSDIQSFLISKTPEKDSVFVYRTSGFTPTSLSAAKATSQKKLLELNVKNGFTIRIVYHLKSFNQIFQSYARKILLR